MPMTKSELVEKLAARFPQLLLRDADIAVKTILDAMSDALARGQSIAGPAIVESATKSRAMVIVSVVSLAFIPIYWLAHGFEAMLAMGWRENAMQAVMQGILAGPGAIYLFARAVVLLGAGRAAVFPSLVPGFTLLIGFLALGIVPGPGFAVEHHKHKQCRHHNNK